jgi:hypothetical protein
LNFWWLTLTKKSVSSYQEKVNEIALKVILVLEGLRQLEQVGQDDRVLPVPETTNRVTANNRVGISVVQQLKKE